ncbi:enoyl-CoA hydratase [Sinosporangium album]|uniref:Enoyl-CoA hydratase n=1 Tax=Sinosporangium album TaxID=504805 RepID=A0A1G8IT46_9ACTN|nr:enoyl-CoA hydratase/isomerase family protein [Sinosporangium album]SDI22099.1 enoyl-CoA hydratase [Sinosporangium album]
MSESTGKLHVRSADGVQTWLMEFPPVNAIDPAFLDSLESALDEAERDESVSAVVLGSALRVFSAGADATWMSETVGEIGTAGLVEVFNRTMDRFRRLCVRIRRSDLLVVAAMDGHTLAGGLELAAACDLRVAADDDRIKIGVPEMDLFGALPSGGGGSQFLARLMGPARALRFILEAKPVTPSQARDLGIVEELCDSGGALERAETFAGQVAAKAGRIGVAAAKRSILDGADLPLSDAMLLDRAVHWDAMRRGNFPAGVEAFTRTYGRRG